MKKNGVFRLMIFLLIVSSAQAQKSNIAQAPYDSAKVYRVELTEGLEMVGHYVSHDSTTFVLRTKQISRVEIPFKGISVLEEVPPSNFRNGVYWFRNPHATRYFFAPSAFNLKKGEGYYQNAYLFFNSFNVGLTDNISIGGGIEMLSLFGSLASDGEFGPIFFITPKLSFKATDQFRYGLGVYYINVPSLFSDNERTGAGITYAMGTIGDENRNLTVGGGLAFARQEFSKDPIFTVCGLTRISKRTALLSENWLLLNNNNLEAVYSYGIRFFGEKMAVDLGFINNPEIAQAIIVGIPYVDFTVKF
ncbi:MAG: hypothetical protein ACKPB3_09040 [Bacteroidota bacterium]